MRGARVMVWLCVLYCNGCSKRNTTGAGFLGISGHDSSVGTTRCSLHTLSWKRAARRPDLSRQGCILIDRSLNGANGAALSPNGLPQALDRLDVDPGGHVFDEQELTVDLDVIGHGLVHTVTRSILCQQALLTQYS